MGIPESEDDQQHNALKNNKQFIGYIYIYIIKRHLFSTNVENLCLKLFVYVIF